jgi:hypothetical protein
MPAACVLLGGDGMLLVHFVEIVFGALAARVWRRSTSCALLQCYWGYGEMIRLV